MQLYNGNPRTESSEVSFCHTFENNFTNIHEPLHSNKKDQPLTSKELIVTVRMNSQGVLLYEYCGEGSLVTG